MKMFSGYTGLHILFVPKNEYADDVLCLLYTEATANDQYTLVKGKVNSSTCDTTDPKGNW